MSIIVIDPGHGGTTNIGRSSPNNASGVQGTLEKNLTLEIGLLVSDMLRVQGQTVFLTRSTDVNLGLADRASIAKNNQADVFVSIHFNGDDNPSTQGTETLHHPRASNESKLLAASVQQRVLLVTGYNNRGVKAQDLGTLDPNRHLLTTAGCLVEVSFLTDPHDEIRLFNINYKKQIAEAITLAIIDFLQRGSN
jgi:N-acetylmuramoyl-L-alanine amidase